MILTEEAIREGVLTVPQAQAADAAAELEAYEQQAEQCRKQYRSRVTGANDRYSVLNLFVTALLTASGKQSFYLAALAYLAVFVHIAAVIMFPVMRKKLLPSVAASCGLAAASWIFLPLILVNWLILLRQQRAVRTLKEARGYPQFPAVRLQIAEETTAQNEEEQQ